MPVTRSQNLTVESISKTGHFQLLQSKYEVITGKFVKMIFSLLYIMEIEKLQLQYMYQKIGHQHSGSK